ncbi:MAG: RNase adapter RapZ [Ruminococcaceae bacterium]|nr:RNase adapter RapZ [Oscillospiraceae bacterium]
MKLLIVTGMSGSGKSQAIKALEDMGYYCVDNIPPSIIPAFVDLSNKGASELEKLAIVTDIRGGEMFGEIPKVLESFRQNDVDYKILFLDASDETIVRRYKENRRTHPLCERADITLPAAVKKERELLSNIRYDADYVVDTSRLSIAQLKNRICEMVLGDINEGMKIRCKSFGFKYGIDAEADLVFDVRCLPNPFYIEELKNLTGLDEPVRDYVMSFKESCEYRDKLKEFFDLTVPMYASEGKSQLIISFGCTGGQHRSVTFAELFNSYLKEKGYNSSVMHRDIHKL